MENIGFVAGIVLGLVGVLKVAGVKGKYLPLCGVALGVILSFMIQDVSIIGGVIGALTASGLYSGTKSTVK